MGSGKHGRFSSNVTLAGLHTKSTKVGTVAAVLLKFGFSEEGFDNSTAITQT